MRILELTNFSAGVCGVWTRVKEESERLSNLGHEVMVFSSNFTKGSNELACPEEALGGVKIKRFSAVKPGQPPLHFLPGGESYMFWNFFNAFKEARRFKPDVILVHTYRHTHNLFASRLAQVTGAKIFLVTHAPFVEGDSTRSFWGHSASWFYNFFLGRRSLSNFNKIITITKWEEPYLEKLGVKKDKIIYIPNGIPEPFFSKKKSKEEHKILFLGRVSPIKDLETLISAIPLLADKKVKLEIVGPPELEYLEKLKKIVKDNYLESRVIFSGPIYVLSKKISKIDSCKLFVLPSKREAMPQALIEAMSRSKLVIASNNLGSRELISNNNGLLFTIGDSKELAEKIDFALSLNKKEKNKITSNAKNFVEQFKWEKLIKILDSLIRK